MAFDPATDIPDLSQKVFLITGGTLFTNTIAIPAMMLLVLDDPEISYLPVVFP